MQSTSQIDSFKPQIVVIGAGLAGLTAAYRLQEKGYEVQVFEARLRPGGRVLTAKFGDCTEELGGKNFYDAGDPLHSLQLMKDLGLEPLEFELSFNSIYVNNHHHVPMLSLLKDCSDPDNLYDELRKNVAGSDNLQEVIDKTFKNADLKEFFTRVISSYEGSVPKNLDVASIDTVHQLFSAFFEMMQESDAGRPPIFPWLTVKGGNALLPIEISQRLKNKIHYGKSLTLMHRQGKQFLLRFNEGEEILADQVLLAIPCPVFREIDFDSVTIPPDILEKIHAIQYGSVAKILFPYSHDKQFLEIISAKKMVSWSNDKNTIRTLYIDGGNGIFSFNGAKNLLQEGTAIIKNIYPDISIHTLQLESAIDEQLVTYKDAVFKSWALDPYSHGSYLNRAPGTAQWLNEIEEYHGESVRKIFKPLHEKLFFAGEHTTTLDAFGTLEAAIESGERMARLIDKMRMLSCRNL